jgi:hypothetical protein
MVDGFDVVIFAGLNLHSVVEADDADVSLTLSDDNPSFSSTLYER